MDGSAGGLPSGGGRGFDLRDWLRTLRKRYRLILAVWIAVVAAGTIYTLRAKKIYRASGRLVIWGERVRVFAPYADPFVEEWRPYDWWQTQIRLVKARPVMERALKKAGHMLPELEAAKDREGVLLAAVDVRGERDNRVVTVSFEHPDPAVAAEVVNAVMEGYLEEQKSWREKTVEGTEDWLAGELPKAREAVRKAEDTLRDFQNRHGIFSADPSQIPAYVALQSIGRREAELAIEKNRIEAAMKRLEEELRDPRGGIAAKAAREDPRLLENERALQELRLKRLALSAALAEGHVEIRNLDAQIAALEARRGGILAELAREMREEGRRIELELAALKEERARREREVERYTGLFLESERLKSEVKHARDRYEEVATGRFRSGITSRSLFEPARVVEKAVPPAAPFRPRTAQNVAVAAILGLFLGLAVAFLVERLDDSVRGAEDLREYASLTTIGMVPHIGEEDAPDGERTAIALSRPRSQAAEAFRMIRANLDLALPAGEGGFVYLTTSALPSEGKTTVAGNLAAVEALGGKRVLLVDADLRHPSSYAVFGVSDGMGLSHYLSGAASLEQIVRAGKPDGLDIIPAGSVPPNPAELVGGKLLDQLIAWARTRYDLVLLDSPPVLSVADPLVISRLVDGAILVVHAGRTGWMAVRRARETLEMGKARVIGAVLNDSSAEIKRYEGRYGYGYYSRGYYYCRDRDDGEKSGDRRDGGTESAPVEPGGARGRQV
ncbi:MAG: polysaccharide biosynthesis tyrosine autokinase [Planctomycetota bacterium]|nr:polysaccharide biosynthesis tyrosine autokinase [Planctomycetota bacterium]